MSVAILGEQERFNDGSDDRLAWCLLQTAGLNKQMDGHLLSLC
jgi:hypothetical protein